MTTPLWCLCIAAFFPFALSSLGGYFRVKQFGTYDNRNPRAQSAALQGVGARALAAQENSWEALAVFIPSILVAHLAGADAERSSAAAVIFIVSRLFYSVAYLGDLAGMRTAAFLVGLGSCIWLFVLAAAA